MKDKGLLPAYLELERVRAGGTENLAIVVERGDGSRLRYDLKISGEQDFYVAERVVKTLLWILGAPRVRTDSAAFAEYLKQRYCIGGEREFDYCFMSKAFGEPFDIACVKTCEVPQSGFSERLGQSGGGGCRIGLDVGGSEIKVCATNEGEAVYFNSYSWKPKTNTDPDYYLKYFLEAVKDAEARLPRLDGVGVSTAGVLSGKRLKISSLFISLSADDAAKAESVYEDLEASLNVAVTVVNDGDAAALMGGSDVLAISMGTSQAGGYIDPDGRLRGYIAELAFVPVDFSQLGALDVWSGDKGCGVMYFSQDACIRLAENRGMVLTGETPTQKIKSMFGGYTKEEILPIYDTIGENLGYSIAYYAEFLPFKRVLLTGGVTSGEWGERIAAEARAVLSGLKKDFIIELPQTDRRLGQSYAASKLKSGK